MSLIDVPQILVAEVEPGGWIKIATKAGAGFDEGTFRREVADILRGVSVLRGGPKQSGPEPDFSRLLAPSA